MISIFIQKNVKINILKKIIRAEIKSKRYGYVINHDVSKVQVYLNDEFVKEIDSEFITNQANHLFTQIVNGSSRLFAINETVQFMNELVCTSLVASSKK